MKPIKFEKYEGLGNDFVLYDVIANGNEFPQYPEFISHVCDRHFGIGGDGVLLFSPSDHRENRVKMVYFNSDGARAEICVNGLRCMALHAIRTGVAQHGKRFGIEVLSDYAVIATVTSDDSVTLENLSAGEYDPRIVPLNSMEPLIDSPLHVSGEKLTGSAVAVPNPHFVVWQNAGDRESLSREVQRLGRLVEKSEIFPQGTNFELVRLLDSNTVLMEVWERGVGRTLACGSGALATVSSGVKTGRLKRGESVTVKMAGGEVIVAVDESGTLTGPAKHVFSGMLDIDKFKSGRLK